MTTGLSEEEATHPHFLPPSSLPIGASPLANRRTQREATLTNQHGTRSPCHNLFVEPTPATAASSPAPPSSPPLAPRCVRTCTCVRACACVCVCVWERVMEHQLYGCRTVPAASGDSHRSSIGLHFGFHSEGFHTSTAVNWRMLYSA